MSNKKRKPLRFTVGSKRWEAEHVAELLLSDTGGQFNHPTIVVTFTAGEYDRAQVIIRFQRDNTDVQSLTGRELAKWPLDTARQWSESYGGEIELSHRAVRIQLIDRPFALPSADQVRVALARAIARVSEEYNLRHVATDECYRTMLALEKLGLWVRQMYVRGGGDTIERCECDDHDIELNANERAREAARALARTKAAAGVERQADEDERQAG